ncbi:DUF1254 domain-containing protein [Flammeovirga kamogawensis]|uniref:DUF1254 domain-containing protein n=1 Tax=Flammeovirga kamogawensis TaxID=373891 RepID=A0ABX8GQF2_9BACT|nr:DUF1254 domain-containing protein [Flammeovirga kamogawensis]MBB6463051.1 hypothetical protein [Flammeovirga kamogawensis]QWG05688.1 DUF1254 domain-containing protein [Flammeovirga kamogawensis]TRX67516.1 DUF1254 domain-containing protein [Flammeovirga kamogawensis]
MKTRTLYTLPILFISLFFGCNTSQNSPEKVSENLSLEEQVIYQRAFEAIVWGMPATAIYRLREGFLELPEVDNNVIVAYSKPALSKHKAITANTATPYITAYTDLREGPVVLDIPAVSNKASLYGQVVDAWQSTIAGVGPSGADKGKGGKYLFLPPNYDGDVPQGYFVVQSTTYRLALVFRSIRGKNATDKDAYDYTQQMKMYYLSEGEQPTKFVDGIPFPLQSLPRYDYHALEDIHAIFSVEPVLERDKVMMGMLATIGIKPNKPFNPDKKTKAIFNKAAKDAYDYMHQLVKKHHEDGLYWEDRQWSFVMRTDDADGFDFVSDTQIEIDKRAAAWSFFTLYPQKLGKHPATVYLAPTADANGNTLEAGKLYKINVPKNIPAKQFWSITVYDDSTWAFINNPLGRSGLGQFNLPDMEVNLDGSIDIYVGPDAPKGVVSNWIPTSGKKPYIWLRLYGPKDTFWEKSFVMPDVELVQ